MLNMLLHKRDFTTMSFPFVRNVPGTHFHNIIDSLMHFSVVFKHMDDSFIM